MPVRGAGQGRGRGGSRGPVGAGGADRGAGAGAVARRAAGRCALPAAAGSVGAAPGTAAGAGAGMADRGRAAPGPARGASARAAGAGRAVSAAGRVPRPADAGLVPVRARRPRRSPPTSTPARCWSPSSASSRARPAGPAPADPVRRPGADAAAAQPPRRERRPQRVTPRELPPAVPGFTGRSAELRGADRDPGRRPGGQGRDGGDLRDRRHRRGRQDRAGRCTGRTRSPAGSPTGSCT